MTCLNEKVVGAIFLMLSGSAFADGLVVDSSDTMTVANIAPAPMEVIPPIPDPQRYLQRYSMEYQPDVHADPLYAQIGGFYSAQVTHDFQLPSGSTVGSNDAAAHTAQGYLRMGPSSAPLISMIDLPNTTLTLGAQPQRRLSVSIDSWVFSATARIAVLHSHSTGATVSVRHGF
ncbi:hypothetical protein [Paraburkholderia metrosideri]|jgi:hypothetical protein|uniref:Uncharacterized protein n=1 Tax=Paraburkholderia metrosideri TaxID=580937 RepID=A0ABN7HZX7_9BURK|nr:hypothetical protein [Paraburkholderia metrosideri]CAD6546612.1 hypothetical protein LMG28140_04357 [Paraburkholderia metrosideri]